jgi:SP family facilitated glucose transporter-like MFS transporter 8
MIFITSIVPTKESMQAKRGRGKDFVAALQILRGKDADITEEAEEIQVSLCSYIINVR